MTQSSAFSLEINGGLRLTIASHASFYFDTSTCSRSPSRQTTNKRFSSEMQLVSMIRDVFGDGHSRKWTWMEELNSPSGTADLVAVQLCSMWQQQESMSRIPARWLYALKCLPLGVSINLKTFAASHGVSVSCAQDVLTAYTQTNYCTYHLNTRVWTKEREPKPVAEHIVAIEAKLRDWRRALYQAAQYASYAFEAWVVLDEEYLSSASIHIDEFESRGVGLMGLSVDGQSEILRSAVTRPPKSTERFWQANAEIAKRLFI